MTREFTRQELYDLVWSKPMKRVASELGVDTWPLTSLLRRAGIPTPPPGYWMMKEFGKPVVQPPLPPAPEGIGESLTLNFGRRPKDSSPKSEKSKVARAETVAASATKETPEQSGETVAPPRSEPPTQPTKVTRDELYGEVWETPMRRLAERFGISGNGLAKICDREDVPYPPRGYWAKLTAGKPVTRAPLPKATRAHQQIVICPTPLRTSPAEMREDVRRDHENAREQASTVAVADRLVRPHPIVARWLADHEEKKRSARQERDPWRRKLYDPGDFSDADRRKHRLLDALFKAFERQGAKVHQGERYELFAVSSGEKIEFQIREKQKQVRRPLTADEQRWRMTGDKDWKQELAPTGRLVFDIKTYLPAGLKQQWVETDQQTIEDMLPDIVGTFIAAGPALVQRRREQEAAERERQLAERHRYEEQQKRKRDANRWRIFQEMAQDWRAMATTRDFLNALRVCTADSSIEIDGRSLASWLDWADEWLARVDPMKNGVGTVFERIAAITEWSYRD